MENHFENVKKHDDQVYRKFWSIMFAKSKKSQDRETISDFTALGITEHALHMELYKNELELRLIITDESDLKFLDSLNVEVINNLELTLHNVTGAIEMIHDYDISELTLSDHIVRNTFHQLKFKMKIRVSKITKIY